MTDRAPFVGFALNQTMLRVRDPKASVTFYCDVLGMTLLQQIDLKDLQFSVYLLGYLKDGESIPDDLHERAKFVFSRETTLELTHNWGTEEDQSFPGYHNGNADPKGFGHIGISVPDVAASCARFEKLGIKFIKKPDDGAIKGIAFICDPDGYWIEILSPTGMTALMKAVSAQEEA